MIKNIEYFKIIIDETGEFDLKPATYEIKLLKKELETLKKVKFEDELLTPDEVVKFLKLPNKQRLNDMRAKGQIPTKCYVKLDGVGYRYKKRELYKWARLNYD